MWPAAGRLNSFQLDDRIEAAAKDSTGSDGRTDNKLYSSAREIDIERVLTSCPGHMCHVLLLFLLVGWKKSRTDLYGDVGWVCAL